MRYSLQRCVEGRWELAETCPGADLARDVARYAGYMETCSTTFHNREVAAAIVPLIINFGADFHVSLGQSDRGARYGSFTAGLYDGFADVTAVGRSHCMQVDFTPPGAYRFFGLPMRELAGRVIRLEDILGQEAALLAEQLQDAPDWGKRFNLLDAFVRNRFAGRSDASREISWAWQKLVLSGGTVPVATLASELGWSRKHLTAQFSAQIGETPKTVARILRFVRTRRYIAGAGARSGWAEIAAQCGFADQAHLIREFNAMAGVTPAQYVATLATNTGGPETEPR